MSIVVDIERLEATLDDYPVAYLLTAATDGAVKAVTVEPRWADGILLTDPSRGTAINLSIRPKATLVFPPREVKGYTLIIDGTAEAAHGHIALTPERAVLHRPASHSDGPIAPNPSGCGHDCAPV